MKKSLWTVGILLSLTGGLLASPFAASVVNSGDWAANGLYNDPAASVVGKPTTLIYDPGYNDPVWGYPASTTACSVVNSPFNTDPSGNKLITVLNNNEVIAAFDHDIRNDAANPYGRDFIVYSAYAFTGSDWVTEITDMDTYSILDGSLATMSAFNMTVSVSPDLVHWYTYSTTINNSNYLPTQAYAWNSVLNQWAGEMDWTKPLNPALTQADFGGKTVAQAIAMYDGSAGGMAFDLTDSGFDAIRYIKVSGTGKIDGFADVAATPEPVTIVLFGLGGLMIRHRQSKK